jgi:hypothetical protein
VTLDQIEDIELLRKAALLLQEDNKKLVRLIAKHEERTSCAARWGPGAAEAADR